VQPPGYYAGIGLLARTLRPSVLNQQTGNPAVRGNLHGFSSFTHLSFASAGYITPLSA